MNFDLKRAVDKVVSLSNEVAVTLGLDMELGDAIKMELLRFMMYLSASDGQIQREEADEITYYLGVNLSPTDIANYIREKNIYSKEFETTVPVTFKILVDVANKLNLPEAATSLYRIYDSLGQELINSDYVVDSNETIDLNIYMSTLKNYLDNNLMCIPNSTSGFVKNDNSSTAGFVKNSGSSVIAPKKG